MYKFNIYSELKALQKKAYQNSMYLDLLSNTLCEMFTYTIDNNVYTFDGATIEKIMIARGQCGFTKINNVVTPIIADDGGVRDINGVGNLITGTSLAGKLGKGLNGVSAVLGYNNAFRVPDLAVYKFSDILTEVDVSMETNVLYARNYPIFVAKSQQIADKIKQAFKNMKKGEPITITKEGVSVGNSDATIETTNITDISTIDKLQYLSTFHNDLLRRFYTIYGQALGEGMKQAQQSVAEIASNVSMSFIIPLQRLEYRKKMCADLERIFGGSISVEFSEPWLVEFEKWNSNTQENQLKNEGVNDENTNDFKSN